MAPTINPQHRRHADLVIALGKIGSNEPGYIHTVHDDGYVAKNVVWLS